MTKDNLELDPRELYFLPLGGSEQFGVNFNLYAHGGEWLAIDFGIGFADEKHPGVDILLPDPAFLEERRDDLLGLVVTHAHEDHVGALPYLWPRLKCPIWCTPFTAEVLKRKFSESPECRDAKITVVRAGEKVKAGPFTMHFVHVAHSIPDTVAVVVETKVGRVLHSGDWNLDPTPVINGPTDEETIKAFGRKGIIAYVGDSTNSNIPGRSGSELEVEEGLTKLFGEIEGRIAVTMFASNVGRMRSVARAARAHGRHVALVGRSLLNMAAAARDCGYLGDVPPFLDLEEISDVDPEKTVIILTGSQGEARAALARVARGDYNGLEFGRGDTVVFSARPIPGNEREINEVCNNLIHSGARVIGWRDTKHTIHVSGHPCQDELADMYQWTRPSLVVPVHGERIHLEAQAAFAKSCQIENVIIPINGSVIKLSGTPEVVGHVETGLLAVEPRRVLPADHAAIAERRKLQYTGAVHVTVVLDRRGELAGDPQITTMGLIDAENEEEAALEEDLIDEVEDILADMERDDRMNDHMVHEEVRIGIRRFVQNLLNMKPKTAVHVVRI
jgi:ribonuclease J